MSFSALTGFTNFRMPPANNRFWAGGKISITRVGSLQLQYSATYRVVDMKGWQEGLFNPQKKQPEKKKPNLDPVPIPGWN